MYHLVKLDDLFAFDALIVASGLFETEPRRKVADGTLDAKGLAPSQHQGRDMPADILNEMATVALIVNIDRNGWCWPMIRGPRAATCSHLVM